MLEVVDELPGDAFVILQGQGRFRANDLLFERPVKLLQFAVGLREMG